MISGATRGAGGAALGNHLGNVEVNEAVLPGESRGLMSNSVEGQIAELTRMGSHARTHEPLYHIHADPPEGRPFTPQERADYWQRIEKELGFESRPFSSTIHIKNGREHEHRVYLRTRADGTAIRLDHDYARREKVDRITEWERGEPLTKGAHNRAVIQTLAKERPEIAAAMTAAGLHNGPRPVAALSPKERVQQDRTNVSKADVAKAAGAAWRQSDSGQAFAAALSEKGLRLAQGDKRPVIIDASGNSHSVKRMLDMDARSTGGEAPKAVAIRDRLDGLDLPRVTEARQQPVPVLAEQPAPVPPAPPSPVSQPITSPLNGMLEPAVGAAAGPVSAASAAESVPSRDAPQTVKPSAPAGEGGSGGGGAAPSASQASGPKASLADAGNGPGEPPGPGASPDEQSRYRAKLAAYEERKASVWAAWVRGQQQELTGGKNVSSTENGDNGAGQRASAEAVKRFLADLEAAYHRARSEAEIRAAVDRFNGECAGIGGSDSAERGHDKAAGGDDNSHASEHGRSPVSSGRFDESAEVRGSVSDIGNPVRPDDIAGKSGADRAAARKNIEDAATAARFSKGLSAQPEAMQRLKEAAAALTPDPFRHVVGRERFAAMATARDSLLTRFTLEKTAASEAEKQRWTSSMLSHRTAADALVSSVKSTGTNAGKTSRADAYSTIRLSRQQTVERLKSTVPVREGFEQWLERQGRTDPAAREIYRHTAEQRERREAITSRITADRDAIARVLSSHPHPDPADLDPAARANRYASRLSDGLRERQAAAESAEQAAAHAAAQRSTVTRMLAALGITTPEQRRTDELQHRAHAAAEIARRRRPTSEDYRRARSDGAAHAYAAVADVAAWKERPDVAQALENHRLNTVVQAAVQTGDTEISKAMKAGDPESARAMIRAREIHEEQQLRLAEEARNTGRKVPQDPGHEGRRGPRMR